MEPKYRMLPDEPTDKEMALLQMNAWENPVSSRQVKLKGTPVIATYHRPTAT